jgi:hypothetical protein
MDRQERLQKWTWLSAVTGGGVLLEEGCRASDSTTLASLQSAEGASESRPYEFCS